MAQSGGPTCGMGTASTVMAPQRDSLLWRQNRSLGVPRERGPQLWHRAGYNGTIMHKHHRDLKEEHNNPSNPKPEEEGKSWDV